MELHIAPYLVPARTHLENLITVSTWLGLIKRVTAWSISSLKSGMRLQVTVTSSTHVASPGPTARRRTSANTSPKMPDHTILLRTSDSHDVGHEVAIGPVLSRCSCKGPGKGDGHTYPGCLLEGYLAWRTSVGRWTLTEKDSPELVPISVDIMKNTK